MGQICFLLCNWFREVNPLSPDHRYRMGDAGLHSDVQKQKQSVWHCHNGCLPLLSIEQSVPSPLLVAVYSVWNGCSSVDASDTHVSMNTLMVVFIIMTVYCR